MAASPPPREPSTRARRRALLITLGYVTVAGVWIAAGDWLLFRLLADSAARWPIGAATGGVLVAATAALLYHLMRVRDSTARDEPEREHGILAAALEATSDSVLITDPRGRIEYANPTFSKTTGWDREEVLGRNP